MEDEKFKKIALKLRSPQLYLLENRPSSENKEKNPGELTNQNTEQHDQEETQVEKFLSGKKLYLTGTFLPY